MFDKSGLLKLINQPDKRLLAAKALDLADLCLKRGKALYSAFLEIEVLSVLLRAEIPGVELSAFGGYEESERKVLAFLPEGEKAEFPIKAIEITSLGNAKFSHRDVLGACLGLGITRDRIGDILMNGNKAFVFALDSVAPFLLENLTFVGKNYVETKEVFDLLEVPKPRTEELKRSVPSLRLDAVISACFNVSREKAKEACLRETVFVNHASLKNPDVKVKAGDRISLKGKGKVRLKEVVGKSQKGRMILLIEKYI